jgi:hypothetical protein
VSLKDKTRQETKDEKWTRKNKTVEVSVKDKVDKKPDMRETGLGKQEAGPIMREGQER